ncbi:class I SAM-dependent methyltransferase [Haliea atlantica]
MEFDQIICGEAVETLKTFEAGCVDLVVTDPPYLCSYRDRQGRTLAGDSDPAMVLPVYDELFRVLKQNSYCITFYGWNNIAGFSGAWAAAGFRTVGHFVWPKPYASKSGFARYCHESAFLLAKGRPRQPARPISDVQRWEFSGNKAHPTEKAVSVIAPLIKSYSEPGDAVLDPFSGSGSTAVAAALTGRRYLGIEIEEKYCVHARSRLAGVARRTGGAIAA